ncbi:hypothetical protein VP01_105g1 [Puccinia sorghi]|uniref:Uncharacterized protein n=1 Tax=Puccinia sorghi TaxID=27349 RepID=A0A0L6VU61_9BASI|nr:hypothetical protein VP01_105g1 [Puccinia sorghi]
MRGGCDGDFCLRGQHQIKLNKSLYLFFVQFMRLNSRVDACNRHISRNEGPNDMPEVRGKSCVFNRAVSIALACNLKYITSQVELRMKYSFHLLNKSFISFAHPIILEIIFEFQKTVKDHKENEVIHAQGLIFCLEIIITNISYGHHFMTLIFFFYVMITLRIWIKALLNLLNCLQLTCSMLQPSFHPNSTCLNFEMFWNSQCAVFTVNLHQILVESLLEKGLSKNRSFLGFSAFQLHANHLVFKFAKATVSRFCLCILLHDRGNPSAHSWNFVTITYGHTLWAFLILGEDLIFFQHDIKLSCNQVTKEFLLNCGGYRLNSSSPKIRLSLCTIYNQDKTGISSVYDQFKRKRLHVSAMEKALFFSAGNVALVTHEPYQIQIELKSGTDMCFSSTLHIGWWSRRFPPWLLLVQGFYTSDCKNKKEDSTKLVLGGWLKGRPVFVCFKICGPKSAYLRPKTSRRILGSLPATWDKGKWKQDHQLAQGKKLGLEQMSIYPSIEYHLVIIMYLLCTLQRTSYFLKLCVEAGDNPPVGKPLASPRGGYRIITLSPL